MFEMMKVRVRFKRNERVKFISHLDQNRAFSRAVNRSKLPIWHTEGFNPHPYIVFSPPLSVGFTSQCEVMDFRLTESLPLEQVKSALSLALPEGFEVYDVYESEKKLSDIVYAGYLMTCQIGGLSTDNAAQAINDLFAAESIIVLKKSKKGEAESNIKPLIKSVTAQQSENCDIIINAVLSASAEGYLNPEYLISAVKRYVDGISIEYTAYDRVQFYNKNMEIFR